MLHLIDIWEKVVQTIGERFESFELQTSLKSYFELIGNIVFKKRSSQTELKIDGNLELFVKSFEFFVNSAKRFVNNGKLNTEDFFIFLGVSEVERDVGLMNWLQNSSGEFLIEKLEEEILTNKENENVIRELQNLYASCKKN